MPRARGLVSAVNAARPTARPPLSSQQFLTSSLNTPMAGFWLFRILDPANELVATERCQAVPKRKNIRIGAQSDLHIFGCRVDCAVEKADRHASRSSRAAPVNQHRLASQALPPGSSPSGGSRADVDLDPPVALVARRRSRCVERPRLAITRRDQLRRRNTTFGQIFVHCRCA